LLEVVEVNLDDHTVRITVVGTNEKDEVVISGTLKVCPPYRLGGMDADVLDNF
jgi:3-hydroxybutyryl-CoA dehydratase